MKYAIANLALLGHAAAFPALRGVFAADDVKEVFRRNYLTEATSSEASYHTEPSYPVHTPSSGIGYETASIPQNTAPHYPTNEPHSYPNGEHHSYPTGEPHPYPTGEPHPYPTGGHHSYPGGKPHQYPTGKPHTYPTGTGHPPKSYPHESNSYTKTSTKYGGTSYTTITTTGYTTVTSTSTSFCPTSTPIGHEGDKTYYSTYLTPTYIPKTVTIPTTGYEVIVPSTSAGTGYPTGGSPGGGYECPAAKTVTATVYVTATPSHPGVPEGPSGDKTYTSTDKYGSTTTIVIPGTTYPGTPEPTTYKPHPEPESSTYKTQPEQSSSTKSLPPYPTGTGSSGYPHGTGKPSTWHYSASSTGYPHSVPAPTGGYPHHSAPTGGYPHQPAPTEGYPSHPAPTQGYPVYTPPTENAYPTKAWYALF